MLSSLLNKENIVMNLESSDKEELFAEMVEVVIKNQPSLNRSQVLQALMERESLSNTCVKPGIAVPHCSISGVNRVACVMGISKAGVDYEAKDALGLSSYNEALVHLVVMFVFDSTNKNDHLKTLAYCAHDFQSPEFYKNIINAKNIDEVLNIIREFEEN